jgi:hypothetical protein
MRSTTRDRATVGDVLSDAFVQYHVCRQSNIRRALDDVQGAPLDDDKNRTWRGQKELTKYDDSHIDGAKYAQLISFLEEPVLTLSRKIKKNMKWRAGDKIRIISGCQD